MIPLQNSSFLTDEIYEIFSPIKLMTDNFITEGEPVKCLKFGAPQARAVKYVENCFKRFFLFFDLFYFFYFLYFLFSW